VSRSARRARRRPSSRRALPRRASPKARRGQRLGEFLHRGLDGADVLQDVSREPERRVCEAQLPTVELENALAVIVGREQRKVEIVRERAHAMLGRTDPLAAELHHRAIRERVVEQPPADAVASLEHHDRTTRRLEVTCSCQPGQAGTHHDHINLTHIVPPEASQRRAPQPDAAIRSAARTQMAIQLRDDFL
jgi:hypothetical protein